MDDKRRERRHFMYEHPTWTKVIIAMVALVVVVLAFAVPAFGTLCGLAVVLLMAFVMLYAVASIIYSILEGVVPEKRRPRRRDR